MAKKKKQASGLQYNEEGMAFIDFAPHLKNKPTYIMAMGERSNGKTYGSLKYALEDFIKSGYRNQLAYVRRNDVDIKPAKMSKLFDGIIENGVLYDLTDGVWDRIVFRSSAFYLAKYDEDLDKIVTMEKALGYAFALNIQVHYKSVSYPKIQTIIFDEFLTRAGYLPDEFVEWMNLISTIVRRRTNVLIFMLANTVSRSSLYFREMGLTKIIKTMEQGTIQYHETKKGTKLSIEYCADANVASKVKNTVNDTYYGFDNLRLDMIKAGSWETGMFPHKPFEFDRKKIRYEFFVYWEFEIIRGMIVQDTEPESGQTCDFLFFEPYITDDITKIPPRKLIYTPDHSPLPNYRRKITQPTNALEDTIASYFRREKTFYSDNTTGDNILNYVNWCGNARFI